MVEATHNTSKDSMGKFNSLLANNTPSDTATGAVSNDPRNNGNANGLTEDWTRGSFVKINGKNRGILAAINVLEMDIE